MKTCLNLVRSSLFLIPVFVSLLLVSRSTYTVIGIEGGRLIALSGHFEALMEKLRQICLERQQRAILPRFALKKNLSQHGYYFFS